MKTILGGLVDPGTPFGSMPSANETTPLAAPRSRSRREIGWAGSRTNGAGSGKWP
jgi:hypothetical protein